MNKNTCFVLEVGNRNAVIEKKTIGGNERVYWTDLKNESMKHIRLG